MKDRGRSGTGHTKNHEVRTMPFKLIKGTFHVKGYSPDGDSVKFRAKKAANWTKIEGKKIEPNQSEHVQLRVEGIDSLETHYSTNPPTHQPLELAHAACDELLSYLRITNVTWGSKHGQVTMADDGTEGYILARTTGPYGRPICFVFSGSTDQPDGSDVFLDTSLVETSLNYHMLSIGHAYPLFYETLFYDLRNTLAEATRKARDGSKGIWGHDKTNTWIDGTDIQGLQDTTPILPKLFRRLIDHSRSQQPFSEFGERLATERVTIIPTVHHTHFDTVVEIQGNKLRMTEKPEDIIMGTVLR